MYSNIKKNFDDMIIKHDSQGAELLRLQRISNINAENSRVEIQALESRNERLTYMLDSETVLRRQNEERASKYDHADAELIKLRKEVFIYKYTYNVYNVVFDVVIYYYLFSYQYHHYAY